MKFCFLLLLLNPDDVFLRLRFKSLRLLKILLILHPLSSIQRIINSILLIHLDHIISSIFRLILKNSTDFWRRSLEVLTMHLCAVVYSLLICTQIYHLSLINIEGMVRILLLKKLELRAKTRNKIGRTLATHIFHDFIFWDRWPLEMVYVDFSIPPHL